jgi:hypothetical protein
VPQANFTAAMFTTVKASLALSGVEIRGNQEFRQRTSEALLLLEPLVEYETIVAYLAVIRQGRRSGVTAWAARPIFTVGTPTWRHSAIWYAGAIAHDACHAKLYRDAKARARSKKPAAGTWSGKAAEIDCLLFQRRVLLGLRADKSIIDYIETHARNPTYQGRNKGWRGWLDYRKRWW